MGWILTLCAVLIGHKDVESAIWQITLRAAFYVGRAAIASGRRCREQLSQ